MFAIGILAHSFLLPFISIFVQVFVMSVCLKMPSELPQLESTSNSSFYYDYVSIGSSDRNLDTYNFIDHCEIVYEPSQLIVHYPVGNVIFISFNILPIKGCCIVIQQLRAPPFSNLYNLL